MGIGKGRTCAGDTGRCQGARRRAGALAGAIAVVVWSGAGGFNGIARAQVPAQALPDVDVVGSAPLPGIGQPRTELPSNVQSSGLADLARSGEPDLGSFLNRRFSGVHINDIQGNPFQADVNFRGYTASSLLGTPQGLSVYMDGVRLNQPFGDVVSWDLIPRFAISSITLMPGANPLFGLNTLGGALSIQTKDGRRFPGGSAQLSVGSWGRRTLALEQGGFNKDNGLDWYVAGQLFKERGWRDSSASDLRQLFAKVGWSNAATDLKLTLAYADNELNGNGLQEQRLLDARYDSVYTRPDTTGNRSLLLALSALHSLDERSSLSGNLYFRKLSSSTFNGDLNSDSLNQSVYQPNAAERAALAAAGYSGFPTSGANASNTPFPFWRCIANVLLNDEPAEKCSGLINRTALEQRNWGLTGQYNRDIQSGRHRHQLTVGLGYDASTLRFRQSTELGYLNPDRTVTGLGAFGDGVTGGDVDGQPYDTRVDLQGRVSTWSLYAMDTWTIDKVWHITASGRYNQTRIRNSDAIHPGGGLDSLDGDHSFSRLNPALGLSYAPSRQWNAYLGYSEGSRAPTSVELGCANPANPCKLPNAMAGDPPLEQVVTRSLEAGLRGRTAGGLIWNLGLFRAENRNDILFVADNVSGFGYFKNFGKTLRQGLEAGLSGRMGAWSFATSYTLLDATYRSAETVLGAGNSSNSSAQAGFPGVDGTINIRPGDRIPLIPRHLLKLDADYRINAQWQLGGHLLATSGVFARGNENNQAQVVAPYYLGAGKTSGYAVLNLQASYTPDKRWRVFAYLNNVFDRRYASAAQLGPMGLSASGNFQARPFPANANGDFPLQSSSFLAPGAPRSLWLGARLSW